MRLLRLARAVLLYSALAAGCFLGCKSEEPKEPVLQSVALVAALPEKPKPKRDFKKELEQIIEEHNVKNIDSFYFYTTEQKQELFSAMQKKYTYGQETIQAYQDAFEARKNMYGVLVLLPRDRMGTGQGSLMCLFPGMSEYIITKYDLVSEIADYASHRAKDNAKGIILCGKKMGADEINLMTPLVYQDILEIRARTYQISEIARKNTPVSQKFKEMLFLKYTTIVINLGIVVTNLEVMKKKAEQEGTVFEHQQVYFFIEDAIKQAKEMFNAKEVKTK